MAGRMSHVWPLLCLAWTIHSLGIQGILIRSKKVKFSEKHLYFMENSQFSSSSNIVCEWIWVSPKTSRSKRFQKAQWPTTNSKSNIQWIQGFPGTFIRQHWYSLGSEFATWTLGNAHTVTPYAAWNLESSTITCMTSYVLVYIQS